MKGIRVLTCAIFGLLFSCVTANSPIWAQLTGPSLQSINVTVTNKLFEFLQTKLTEANNTINELEPLVSSCLGSIQTRQSQCIECVNTTCQDSVATLGCTDVKPLPSSSSCSVGQAICDISVVVINAQAAVTAATNTVAQLAQKISGKIEKVVVQTFNKVVQGLKSVENVGNKVINGIEKTANQVASGVENVVKQAGQAISKGVNDAINAVEDVANKVANGVEDAANKVGDAFKSIGRRRRQAQAPTCDDFANNDTACLYYQSQCTSCNGVSSDSSVDALISQVCGQSDLTAYNDLTSAIQTVEDVLNIANAFMFHELQYDQTAWGAEGNSNVEVKYAAGNGPVPVKVAWPINPFDDTGSAEPVARTILNDLFPVNN